MGETGLIFPKTENWHLRGTLIIIGIASWIFGIAVIVRYSHAFFADLTRVSTRGGLFQPTGQRDYILLVLGLAIDSGFLGMCDFTIWPNRTSAPTPGEEGPPSTEPIPTLVNQEACEWSVEKERSWQHAELHNDRWKIFARVEHAIQSVFLGLDVLMIFFGCLAGIIGYLLIHGAVWKRRKHLIPWLLLSFTIAYASVFYGILHIMMEEGFNLKSASALGLAVVGAVALIVIVLHAMAFYAVAKYYVYLWRPEGQPEYPIRRMKLILSRT